MKKKLLLLAVPFLSLVSCQSTNGGEIGDYVSYLTDKDSGTATIRIFKDESATSKNRYISPKNVELSMDYNTISGTLSNNENDIYLVVNLTLQKLKKTLKPPFLEKKTIEMVTCL